MIWLAEEEDPALQFYRDGKQCRYLLFCEGEEVVLQGESCVGDRLLFRERISFSRELSDSVSVFARSLAQSNTDPVMMVSLAEDFFS